jgi:hypothetical protein
MTQHPKFLAIRLIREVTAHDLFQHLFSPFLTNCFILFSSSIRLSARFAASFVVVVLCYAVSFSPARDCYLFSVFIKVFLFFLFWSCAERGPGQSFFPLLFCLGGYVVYCVCVCVSSAKASADCVISLLSPYPSAPPFFSFLYSHFLSILSFYYLFFFLGLDCLVSPCESKRPNHITLFSFIFLRFIYWCSQFLFFFEYFLRVLPVLCSR